MPAFAPVTIADGATTPVSHTYTPTKIDASGVATWQERVSGVPVGYPTLTGSVRAPSAQAATFKPVFKLVLPKVITTTDVSGKTVTSVDYTNFANTDFVFNSRSSKQERKDARVLLMNWLASAAAISMIDDLESAY